MATTSDVVALAESYRQQQIRNAAAVAALVALYYRQRVNVDDPAAVEAWLALMIPRIISGSDSGSRIAATFFDELRHLEVSAARPYTAVPTLGVIDEGVRKSLLTVGPFAYTNKMAEIKSLDVGPQQKKALIAEAKQVTSDNLAAAVMRHAQAGSRQTIYDNAQADPVAIGYIRVTKAKPCYFCAMLASRGIHYRGFGEDSFVRSDAKFTGDGDAKVHDSCGCSLKPVYTKNDEILQRNQDFTEMWQLWGAHGSGKGAVRLFRRGYDHWVKTDEMLDISELAA